MDLLYSRVRKGERVDRLWWKLAPQEIFDVRSYHKVTIPFPIVVSLEDYGVPKVASKINFFVWMVALGRVLTNDNLRKRRLIVIDWYV